MKFLIHGNAPTVKTGYGIQIAQLAEQLRADGHEPACSSTYGIQGGVETWRDIRVYGCGYDVNSNDRLHMHANHWFMGEPGWIITCVDVWALKNPLLAEFNVAAWVPVDHFPLQPNVREFFALTQAVPVAMSKFGERQLFDAGLDPVYIPLSIDTEFYKPTPTLGDGLMTCREMLGVPEDAFVVGMVAMNKGWAKDRKGFNEAFWAFGQFERQHPDAYLYVHADKWGGAEGQNLVELAVHAGIPEHKLIWAGGPNQYGYYIGYTPEMMAGVYTAIDVLLAPSHGEGFCVPLVEAQACGTPVIANDFSAQAELVGQGWRLLGQPEWDPALHAAYVCPLISDVLNRLEDAYEADRATMVEPAIKFASQFDVKKVYQEHWVPFIAQLEADPTKLAAERDAMPDKDAVAVVCPIHLRTEHIQPLVDSFLKNTPEGEATLYFVADAGHHDTGRQEGKVTPKVKWLQETHGTSCAQRWNAGYEQTTEPWVLCIGDDVRFHEGWLDGARKLSTDYDVIGTNDTAGKMKNPKVANGSHADHFFVRRSYVEEYGACLDGPGVLAPEAYGHWYTDMEIVKLAKARGVFSPCLDSVVEHLHPGYDGDEAARQADPTYMAAVGMAEADEKTFRSRLPLIEMQRTSRGKL